MNKYRICQQDDFRYYVQEKRFGIWWTVKTYYGSIGGTFDEVKLFNTEREAEHWIDEDIAMYKIERERKKIPNKSPREYP